MADLLAGYRNIIKIVDIKNKARKELKQDIEHREVTEPTFLKVLGKIGSAFNVPLNIAFNVNAKKLGMEKVPLFSSHLQLSDALEAANIDLRENLEWQRYKPYINFLAPIFGDITTYLAPGAKTVAGKIAAMAKGGKIAPALDAAGAIAKTANNEILYTIGKRADGTIQYLNNTPVDIIKNKTLYKTMDELGYLKTDIPKLGATMAERIKEGQQGAIAFELNPLGAFNKGGATAKIIPFATAQAKIAEKFGKGWETVVKSAGMTGKSLRLSGLIKLEDYLRKVGLENVANSVRDLEIVPASAMDNFMKEAKIEQGVIKNIADKIHTVYKPLDPLDPILDDAVGLTRKEMDAFNIAAKYGSMGTDGKYAARIFNIKNGDIVDDYKMGFADFEDILGKNWRTTHKELIDYAVDVGQKVKKDTTGKYREVLDKAGISAFTQSDYIKQIDWGTLTKQGKEKIIKSSKLLNRVINTIFSKGRTWKGFSLEEVSKHRASIYNILAKSNQDFTDAEKVAALFLTDQRLAYGNHTIGDLVSLGSKSDIDKKIKEALDVGDDALFETYESAKKLAEKWDEIKDSNYVKAWAKEAGVGETGIRVMLEEAKKVNTTDLISRAKNTLIDDLYLTNHPALNYFNKIDTSQRIKAVNFMNDLVVDGKKAGIIDLVEEGKKFAGYKKINLPGFATLSDNKLVELGLAPGKKYNMVMRDDVWQSFKASNLEKFVRDPSSVLDPHLGTMLKEWYLGMEKLFKSTTLFLFPAYYIRNVIDNTIKTLVEYIIHGNPHEMLFDMRKAVRIVNKNRKDLQSDVYQAMVGLAKGEVKDTDIILKDAVGKEWTAKELWGAFLDNDIMGRGVREYGILNKNSTVELLRKLEKEGVVDLSKIQVAQKLKQWDIASEPLFDAQSAAGKFGERALRFVAKPGELSQKIISSRKIPINQMMNMGEFNEAVFRLNIFMEKLKKMPFDEAVQNTKLVTIDYGNLNRIERAGIARAMPFYAFQKGTIKYLSNIIRRNPVMMKNIIPTVFEKLDTLSTEPDDRINRGLLRDWLGEATLRTGYDPETKTFDVVNLRGLTSFAELVQWAQPWNSIGASLFPHLKTPLSIIANKNFQTRAQLEPEGAGLRENVLGVPFKKRGKGFVDFMEAFAGQNVRSIRLGQTVERVTESVLKNTDVSIFGTPKKRAWLGLGRISSREPEKMKTIFKRTIIGLPSFEIDQKRTERDYWLSLKGAINNLSQAKHIVNKRLAGDPEANKKEQTRLNNEILKILTKHNKTRVDKLTDKDLGYKK